MTGVDQDGSSESDKLWERKRVDEFKGGGLDWQGEECAQALGVGVLWAL